MKFISLVSSNLKKQNMKEGDIVKLLQIQDQFLKSASKTSVDGRVSVLKKLKASIKSHEQDIVDAIYKDFKKPEFEVLTSELFVAYKELNLFIKKHVIRVYFNFKT